MSAIAARFAVRGGWPALYAANRQAIGPDPNVIHSGTVLVLPGLAAPIHYTVAAGDTLSGIAAEFAVRGGWPALYAANRQVIGPDPGVIHAGTVLTAAAPGGSPPAGPGPPAAPPAGATTAAPAGPRHHRRPVPETVPGRHRHAAVAQDRAGGRGPAHPGAFLAEPVLAARATTAGRGPAGSGPRKQRPWKRQPGRRRPKRTAAQEAAAWKAAAQQAAAQAREPGTAGSGPTGLLAGAALSGRRSSSPTTTGSS